MVLFVIIEVIVCLVVLMCYLNDLGEFDMGWLW